MQARADAEVFTDPGDFGDLQAQPGAEYLGKVPNPQVQALLSHCFGPANARPSAGELAAQLRGCLNAGDGSASLGGEAPATSESAFEATHAFPRASENAMAATLVTPPPASSRGS